MDLVSMNIYGAIIILIAVVIRAIAINKLPKRTFIVLWLIAIVRLTVPFTIPPVINVYPVVDRLNEISGDRLHIAEGYERPNTPPIADTADSSKADSIPSAVMDKTGFTVPIYAIVWSVGFAIFAVLFVVPHARSSGRYKSALPAEGGYISRWREAHPLRRKYKILVSDEISSAFTYGLLRPVIVLPDYEDIAGGRALDYVLTHEYIHIKRFDIALKWISALCVCLNWFNPLVWVMYILLNRDIELSCDEGVLKTLGEDSRKSYAMLLLDMESNRISYNPIVNSFNKYAVKERVTSIMKNKKLGLISVALAFVLVVGSCAVLVSSCSKTEGEDTTINADTQPTQSPDTTQQTTEDDRYANVRFGETDNILLLDIEWYTYDEYVEYIDYNVMDIRKSMEEKSFDENEIEKQVDIYKKWQDERAMLIKNEGGCIPRIINGMPAEQTGYYFTFSNPNNNSDDIYEQSIKNPDGYFEYHLFPAPVCTDYYSVKTGEYVYKNFIKEGYGYASSDKEYKYVLDTFIIPYCDQMLADGDMSQEDYNQNISQNPREDMIRAFFPETVNKN